MVTACIVQARLTSERYGAKVLLPLPSGNLVLTEVLERCASIPGIDVVVLAIPDTPMNDILASDDLKVSGLMVVPRTVKIIRGPEHDVLARYVKAAEAVNADVVMRVTADCPLIDPEVCGLTLAAFGDNDYASNDMPRTFPVGWDCEVFTAAALRRAHMEAATDEDREHVTPVLKRASWAKRNHLFGEPDRSHLRWTLDTLEDYVRIWSVFQEQMREAA